jgi:hypothetical protein
MKYTNTCKCGSSGCILSSNTSYKNFYDNEMLKDASRCKTRCICCNPINWSISAATTTIDVNFSYNINSSKCRIVKKLIESHIHLRETIDSNLQFFNRFEELTAAFESELKINLKFKSYMTKNLLQISDLKKEIELNELIDKAKNTEIRRLKKLNKKLQTCIIQNIPGDPNLNLINEEEEDNDEAFENDENDENEAFEDEDEAFEDEDYNSNEDSNEPLDIVYYYQQVKNYLCKNHMSINKLCKIEQIKNPMKNRIHKAFIKLQIDRVKIAHPQTLEIKNNTDLIETILG